MLTTRSLSWLRKIGQPLGGKSATSNVLRGTQEFPRNSWASLWGAPGQVWQPPMVCAVAPGSVDLDDCMRMSRSPTTELDRTKGELVAVGRGRDHREEDDVVVANGIEAGYSRLVQAAAIQVGDVKTVRAPGVFVLERTESLPRVAGAALTFCDMCRPLRAGLEITDGDCGPEAGTGVCRSGARLGELDLIASIRALNL